MRSFKRLVCILCVISALFCAASCNLIDTRNDAYNSNNKTETQDGTGPSDESETGNFVAPGISEGVDIYHEGFGENKNYVVVIDAGHQDHPMSGKEPSAPDSEIMKIKLASGTKGSFTQIPEYELNLAVALKLRDELLSNGYTVVMVRETNDVEISNMERALLSNRYKPDDENGYIAAINVKIHANFFSSPEPRGALMYCITAQNPNAIGALYEECKALSDSVIEHYCRETGMPQRMMIMDDELTGNNWSEIPTTLIEMGFMSNETDDRLMATEEFRISAARGIAIGIDRYFHPDADAAAQ